MKISLVRPEAQFAKSDSLQSRPCDRQLIAFFVMFGAAQKLSGTFRHCQLRGEKQ